MKTLLRRLGLAVLMQTAWLCPSSQASPKVWNNLSGGSWTNANNWTPAGVPGVADTVFITNNGTYQVSLNVNVRVVSLTLGGTSGTQTLSNNVSTLTLTAASAMRNNGVLVLGGGSLSGSNGVTIASGGELRLTGTGTKIFDTLRLLNQGTVLWLAGDIQSQANASVSFVTNAGLWRVEGNDTFSSPFGGPQPVFVNTASGLYTISQGNNGSFTHNGWQAFAWDFPMSGGTTVRAARGGRVVDSRESSSQSCWNSNAQACQNCNGAASANFVKVLHQDGTEAWYGHFQNNGVFVSNGQRVHRGTPLGRVGTTGCSTGNHLHLHVLNEALTTTVPLRFESFIFDPFDIFNPFSDFVPCYLPPSNSIGKSTQ